MTAPIRPGLCVFPSAPKIFPSSVMRLLPQQLRAILEEVLGANGRSVRLEELQLCIIKFACVHVHEFDVHSVLFIQILDQRLQGWNHIVGTAASGGYSEREVLHPMHRSVELGPLTRAGLDLGYEELCRIVQ